ncbi:MAG: DUF2059 domain-containing protein [Bacteroidota bacterium]
MFKTFSLAAVFLCVAFVAQAQDSYSKKIKEYLEATGSVQGFKVAVKSMMGTFRQSKSNVPAEVWDEMEKEFMGTTIDDLVALLAPIYKQHLTESDLDEIIKFYKSPVGLKMAEKTPIIAQQSMQAGQEWGQKLAEKVAAKLKEKGYN